MSEQLIGNKLIYLRRTLMLKIHLLRRPLKGFRAVYTAV